VIDASLHPPPPLDARLHAGSDGLPGKATQGVREERLQGRERESRNACGAIASPMLATDNFRMTSNIFWRFSRTRLSVYFIKQEAVTNIQAREHLAQGQRKNKEEKRNNNEKSGTGTSSVTRAQETAPRDLS
jgi:hypothetical protein